MKTESENTWAGTEGVKYTKRNPATVEEMNRLKEETYGVTQREIHERYFGDFDRESRVLEVGTNRGIQLEILRLMGFDDLTGVDLNRYALQKGRNQYREINFVEGDARELPFPDDTFDLTFTIGTLVAIPPADIEQVMLEIERVTSSHIWGLEFHAEECTKIQNRGLYWKTDFPKLFTEVTTATEVEREYLSYTDESVEDTAYLLSVSSQ